MKKVLCAVVVMFSLSLNARPLEEAVSPREATYQQLNRINASDLSFKAPEFIFSHTNTRVSVQFKNPNSPKLLANNRQLDFIVNGSLQTVTFNDKGEGSFFYTFTDEKNLDILIEDLSYSVDASVISIWYVVMPILALFVLFVYMIAVSSKKRGALVVEHRNTSVLQSSLKPELKLVRVNEAVEEEA